MIKISIFSKKNLIKVFSLIIFFLAINIQFSQSANISSTSTGGDWNDVNTWAEGVVPGADDNVTIVDGASVIIYYTEVYCSNMTISTGATLYCDGTIYCAGNWINNGGSFEYNSSTVIFNGIGNQAIQGSSKSQTFYNVIIDKSETLTITDGFTVTIMQDLTISTGTLSAGTSTIIVTYQWFNNGGIFLPGTGTVIFNNASSSYYNYITGTIKNQTFNNITIENIDEMPLDASGLDSLTVKGDLLMTSGGFTTPQLTMNVLGNVILNGGSLMTSSLTMYVGGNWTNNGDGGDRSTFNTYDCSCNQILIFNGTTDQIIDGSADNQNFKSIVVNKTSGTLTTTKSIILANDLTLTHGNFIVDPGVLTIDIFGLITLTNDVFMAGNSTVTVDGSWLSDAGQVFQTNGTIVSTGNIIYKNLDRQNVAIGNYKDLTFDDYNKVLLPGNINISGIFTAGTGTGHITTGNTITFTGNSLQKIPSFNTPNDYDKDGYNNLTFTSEKVFSEDISVNGILTFTGAGNITLDSSDLTIGKSGSIAGPYSSSNMIITNSTGKLVKKFRMNSQSFLYPIGTAAGPSYSPITLNINNVIDSGSVAARVTDSIHSNFVCDSTKWLKRYWTLDDNISYISFDYYSANVNYLTTDYNTSFTESDLANMSSEVWDGFYWTNYLISSRINLNPTVDKIRTLGDLTFTVSAPVAQSNGPLCEGSTLNLTSSTISDATSYSWIGPKGFISNEQNPTITNVTADDSGTYYVSADGCTDRLGGSIYVIIDSIPSTPKINLIGKDLVSDSETGNQWYDANGIINEADSSVFTPTKDGDYYVIVVKNVCESEASNIIHFINTNINTLTNNTSINLYPNPNNGNFNIEIKGSGSESYNLEVWNVLGMEIYTEKIITSGKKYNESINLSGIAPGVYQVRLYNAKTDNKKVLIIN